MALSCLAVLGSGLLATPPAAEWGDKTFVAWVQVGDLDQRGGAVLTLDDQGGGFDALVYGERTPRRWMPGSDSFRRTPGDQERWPAEAAVPGQWVVVAAVYEGRTVTLYRDGLVYSRSAVAEPRGFPADSVVLLGLRHLEAGDRACFTGRLREARLYDRALSPAQIAALAPGQADPQPRGWWTFETGAVRDRCGNFPPGSLQGDARLEGGELVLPPGESWVLIGSLAQSADLRSPLHYRPPIGRLGDPIPFYWRGEYHVFYLPGSAGPVNWEHLVSRDLVTWQRLPTALRPDRSDAAGPDGGAMFTGCVVEHQGAFNIFYTGHNPGHRAHREVVRHATSPDLITWTKQRDWMLPPDGQLYSARPDADFRDPYVFWNEDERCWWMLLYARDATSNAEVQALFTSPDLLRWTAQPPLQGVLGQECPDLFSLGDRHYLLGGGWYSSAGARRGMYDRVAAHDVIDRPQLYAGKRLFDGQRQVWFAWIWDSATRRDGGPATWGGTLCLPRELYQVAPGELGCRPVREALERCRRVVCDLTSLPPAETPRAVWESAPGRLTGRASSPVQYSLPVPDSYLLDAQVQLSAGAVLEVVCRQQPDGDGYRLVLDQAAGRVQLQGPGYRYERPCPLPAGQPLKLQVFVTGTVLEAFIDDRVALTGRAYNHPSGRLGLALRTGEARFDHLTVRTAE
ncbi:MAG: family 43 glycosylhydrolase [Fimbriimonadaceae bacterium]|nr:family 43 glycosylhydrolase [Fimbriimonadaceae bacterium]